MANLPTNRANVLKHLQDGKTITPMQCLRLYGGFRLADTIFKLKKEGHNITTKKCSLCSPDPFSGKLRNKQFAEYSLVEGMKK